MIKYVAGSTSTPAAATCPAKTGDTLYENASDLSASTIAGIFVVGDTTAKSMVEVKIPSSVKQQFFFQVCETTPCPTFTHKVQGKDVNYYKLTSANDLAALNPFSVARAHHCTKLAGGIQFSYVDSASDRQCFCACDASSTRVDTGTGANRVSKCVANGARGACNWKSANALGFTKIVMTVATDKSCTAPADTALSVLYPVDNYVDYGRANDQDTTDGKNTTGAGPHIAFEIATDGSIVTKNFAWKEFQANPNEKIKALPLTKFGVFTLKATASDYYNTAGVMCQGCIAVVDNTRPIPTMPCPGTTDAKTLTEFKDEAVTAYNAVLAGVKAFKDSIKGDGCDTVRCDSISITGIKFCGSTANADDWLFFSPGTVSGDLRDVLKSTTAYTQYRRCLSSATVTLKEQGYNY